MRRLKDETLHAITDALSVLSGLCVLAIACTDGDIRYAVGAAVACVFFMLCAFILSEKIQRFLTEENPMPENRNNRYSHVSGPKAKKPPPLDVTKYHRYMPPTSDGEESKPMLIATTKEGLIEKMNAPEPAPVFDAKLTMTAVPDSPNVIRRQAGYLVDGEPET